MFHRWDGAEYKYRKQYSTYISPAGFNDRLEKVSGGGWRMRDVNGNGMSFDPSGNLARLADRNGNALRLEHFGGRLVAVTDDVGQRLMIEYDGNGRISAVRDSVGRVVRYEYAEKGDLIKATRAGNEPALYSYDSSHRLAEYSDPRLPSGSKKGKFAYGDFGRVIEAYDGEGALKHSMAYEYLPDGGRRVTITQACCGNAVHEYDARGLLVQKVDGLGHATLYEWDSNLNMTRYTDRNNHETSFQYNSKGRPTKRTDALGNETQVQYDNALQLPVRLTDALGNITRYSYDPAGNPVSMTDALGGVRSLAHDGYGQLRSVTDPLGNTTRLDYSEAGDLVSVTDALGRTTHVAYDTRHRAVSRTDAKGRTTSFSFDDRDNPLSTTYPDGAVSRTEYDEWNRQVRAIDPLNNTSSLAYDHNDRLSSMTDAVGGKTRYEYDVQGNLLGVRDANGNETTYQYDRLNRMIRMTDAINKAQQYGYDAEGNRVERIDGNGIRTTFVFDDLGRLISRNYPDGTKEAFEYDALGRTVRIKNASLEQTFGYDSLGRVVESEYVTLGKTVRYEWDAVGNRTKVVYPDGEVTDYGFDPLGRLATASDTQAGIFLLDYDEVGNRTMLQYPNGLKTSYSYYSRDRVLSILTEGEGGKGLGAQVPDFRYGYDSIGNRVWMERSDEGRTAYSYDSKYQLTQAMFPDGGYQQFAFDPVGNRMKLVERKGGKSRTTLNQYNSGNELIRSIRDFRGGPETPDPSVVALYAGPGAMGSNFVTEYSYDGNGSRTLEAEGNRTREYVWDYRERLLAVKDGKHTIQSNAYDAYNRRVLLTEGDRRSIFIYDASAVTSQYLVEIPSGDAPARRSVWINGQMLAVTGTTTGTVNCLMADALGSVVAQTSNDGHVIQRATYEPYGESKVTGTHAPYTERAGFIGTRGVQSDNSVCLTYMWNRYADSGNNIFLSAEPIGGPNVPLIAQASSKYLVILWFHKYVYASNSPICQVDPSGLQSGVNGFNSGAANSCIEDYNWTMRVVCSGLCGELATICRTEAVKGLALCFSKRGSGK